MVKQREVYRCNICGNIVEVLFAGGGSLVCCGQDMELIRENTVEASKEKHVPVIEKTRNGIKVKVGSVPHPMEEKHYIQWIELLIGDVSYKKFLKYGNKPEAEFEITIKDLRYVQAKAYCNLHGLWSSG